VSAAGVVRPALAAGARREIPRAFAPWFMPLWIAFVTLEWWAELRRPLLGAMQGLAPPVPLDAIAAAAALGHLCGNAVEALFYMGWWRARGAPLSFSRLFEWLVSISVLDLLGAGLGRIAASHPGWAAHVLAVFAGPGALRADDLAMPSGLSAAFGSLGLLTVVRLVATAALQRQGVGGRLLEPLALTLAAWLPVRIASWWLVDLARGLSPLP
jgi:hypothetical protein